MIMIKIYKVWLKIKIELKKSFVVEFCIINYIYLIYVCIVDFKFYVYIDFIFKMYIKFLVVISYKENNIWVCFLFIVIFLLE